MAKKRERGGEKSHFPRNKNVENSVELVESAVFMGICPFHTPGEKNGKKVEIQ